MNDQSKLMNPPQMIAQPPPQRMMNPPPQHSQLMNPVQPRVMNQAPLLNQSQNLNHPVISLNHQQQPPVMMNNNNNNQHLMMNPRNFNPNLTMSSEYHQNQPNNFGSNRTKTNRSNNNSWKGKTITADKRPPPPMIRTMHTPMYNPPQQPGGYKPPTLNELQSQNRLKTKKFYPKKKYGGNNNRYVPYAPRNTTSFIIRAKKSGGIAELVSPCAVTPAVLQTPMFSPSREVLGDMAKEEWGVDGYGSMKGLIRLRSDGHDDDEDVDDEEEDEEGGSSGSDVEEHVEVERRLDHDLSRFEMIYPGSEYNNVLESRVDDQDSHIAQLEEENLTLKERLFLMERELGDLRRRLQYLERRNMVEEVVENESGSEGGDDTVGSDSRTSGDGKGNQDSCMQDVAVKEVNDEKSNVDEVKETNHKPEGEECEEAKRDMVGGMDQSKESEMVIEKLEDASENDSVGEQGTTI